MYSSRLLVENDTQYIHLSVWLNYCQYTSPCIFFLFSNCLLSPPSLVLGNKRPRAYPFIFPAFILKAKIAFRHFYFPVCLHGFYGLNSAHICDCKNGASCDATSGQCICPAGFYDSQCEKGIAWAFLSMWMGKFCVTMTTFHLKANINPNQKLRIIT